MRKIFLLLIFYSLFISLHAQICSTAFEPNETLATAAAITLGVTNSAAITSSTDKDYYKITTTGTNDIVYSLIGPAGVDFDLFVYNSSGTQLGAGVGVTATETITLNNQPAGTYYIKVMGLGTATSATCYTIKATATVSNGCIVPTGLTSSAISTSGATVSWTAVTGASSYAVDYKLSTAATWTSAATSTTTTSVVLSGLTASTLYNWRIRTNCAGTATSSYATAQFTTGVVSICGNSFEPNETLATAAAITLGVTNSAAITSSTDKDYYKITTTGTNDIVYSLIGPAGVDFDLFVYNSSGTQLGAGVGVTATETITLNNQPAGTYYIKVMGLGTATSATCYTIKATATVSNGCIVPTGLTSSAISTSGATVSWTAVTGASSYAVDYKLSTAATWTSAATSTTTTSVVLSGLTASTLYNWRIRTNCAGTATSSYATAQFTTGVVSICGNSFEPNETLATAAAITLGVTNSAAITSSTDKDYYKITTTGTNDIVYSLIGPAGVDFDLFVYNSSGTQLGAGVGVTATETITLNNQPAGTYYIKVMGLGTATSATCYTIKATASPTVITACQSIYDNSTNDAISGAAMIPFNTNITGTINPSSDIDNYKFVITTGGTIVVSLSTLPADFDLKLLNSAGLQVAISLNGGTTSETINYTAIPGTYYAQVYGFGGISSNACYTLKVQLGTATKENLIKSEFVTEKNIISVYPNPVTNMLNMSLSGEVNANSSFVVMDSKAVVVMQQKFVHNPQSVDVSKLTSGVYLVKINNGGKIVTEKFIKQ